MKDKNFSDIGSNSIFFKLCLTEENNKYTKGHLQEMPVMQENPKGLFLHLPNNQQQ
jgi:hypothetical protein